MRSELGNSARSLISGFNDGAAILNVIASSFCCLKIKIITVGIPLIWSLQVIKMFRHEDWAILIVLNFNKNILMFEERLCPSSLPICDVKTAESWDHGSCSGRDDVTFYQRSSSKGLIKRSCPSPSVSIISPIRIRKLFDLPPDGWQRLMSS